MIKINQKIQQLEQIKQEMDDRLSVLQQQLDQKEQEIQSIRNQIAENIFENTSDYMELQELYIVKRWLERLESEGGEDVDGQ